jgi:hypothetical protein
MGYQAPFLERAGRHNFADVCNPGHGLLKTGPPDSLPETEKAPRTPARVGSVPEVVKSYGKVFECRISCLPGPFGIR